METEIEKKMSKEEERQQEVNDIMLQIKERKKSNNIFRSKQNLKNVNNYYKFRNSIFSLLRNEATIWTKEYLSDKYKDLSETSGLYTLTPNDFNFYVKKYF